MSGKVLREGSVVDIYDRHVKPNAPPGGEHGGGAKKKAVPVRCCNVGMRKRYTQNKKKLKKMRCCNVGVRKRHNF